MYFETSEILSDTKLIITGTEILALLKYSHRNNLTFNFSYTSNL